MTYKALAALGLTFLASSATAQNPGSLLASRLAADAQSTPASVPYRYILDITTRETDEPDVSARFQVDATQPQGSRVTLLETDYVSESGKHSLPEDMRDRVKELEGYSPAGQADDFWCSLATSDGTSITPDMFGLIDQTEDDALFRLERDALDMLFASDAELATMGKSDRKLAKRVLKRLEGEVNLSKMDGEVDYIRFRMTRPMRVAVIARIHDIDMRAGCANSPDGPRHIAQLDTLMTMGLAGERYTFETTERISALEVVPTPD